MTTDSNKELQRIEKLLLQSTAIQLYINGCTMREVSKHLSISATKVVELLKGIKNKQNGKE